MRTKSRDLLFLIALSSVLSVNKVNSSSDIIGSSVVTSVSVILGDDQKARSNSDDKLDETTTLKSGELSDDEFSNSNTNPTLFFQPSPVTAFLRKSGRKDASGVQNVIQALKSIVQEEQDKHQVQQTIQKEAMAVSSSTAKNVDNSKPVVISSTSAGVEDSTNGVRLVPGSSLNGEDDDEMESSGVVGNPGRPISSHDIDEFAKHVVSVQPDETDQDNDTATSAEVHDAIHKISGAILSVDDEKAKKPIENIVTDVLTKINTARNETLGGNSSKPHPPTTAAPLQTTQKPQTTTTQKATKKPSTSAPKTTKATTQKPTTTLRPKPVQTTTTTAKPTAKSTTTTTTSVPAVDLNSNKLKTSLDHEVMAKEPERVKVVKTTMNPNPIIMIDTDMPVMMPKPKPMPPVVLSVKEETMTKPMDDQKMEKPAVVEMMDKPEMADKPMTDKPVETPSPETSAEELPETTEYRVPGLPVDDPFQEAENSAEEEAAVEEVTAPPAKNSLQYFQSGKRPGGNESSSSLRPNEFYDDEIFGYDPYQTFFHGVYVPVVEVGAAAHNHQNNHPNHQHQVTTNNEEVSDEEGAPAPYVEPTRRPPPPRPSNLRPSVKNGKPTKGKKPMPTLPDYLHRPRPSHLQYQHGAVDDTESDTGLLNVHFKHPGSHSYSPEESISPDKLALQPRPSLPQQVRKNFTDHHDQHTLHQHGHNVGGHGHGHGHNAGGQGHGASIHELQEHGASAERRPTFPPAPKGNPGLEATITHLDEEKRSFVDINNRLALRLLSGLTNPVSKSSTSYGNMVISPFTVTSSLGMLFLGSRGHTAAQLDGLLRMDDMLTFNPHMMFHNITESFLSQPNTAAAMIRLLITDKEKGDVLDFYKTRVQHFYEARVEEVDYKFAGHLAQSIINQMIRAQIQRHSYEMLNYSLPLDGPMSLLTAAFFDGQFAGKRDLSIDSMNFIHLAALNQGHGARRLFQVPALGLKGPLRAAYDKDLDATAVEIPYTTRDLSLIAIMPGKPGEFAFGGVNSLKSRMTLESWTKLMRGFYPRDSFKVVLPRFRHQSSLNLSHTISRFGLTDMFQPSLAKFSGVNRLGDLSLDHNMMHFAEFGTWEKLSDTLSESGNKNLDLIRILRPHVREHYGNYGEPMSVNEWIFKSRNPSAATGSKRSRNDPPTPGDVSRLRAELERLRRGHSGSEGRGHQGSHGVNSYTKVRSSKLSFRPRSLRSKRSKNYYFRQDSENPEEETVLRFERPFLYVLRHNPTGMILMTGQYTEPVTEILE